MHFHSVFPAGAGVIPKTVLKVGLSSSFPRRCGSDPGGVFMFYEFRKFSPQVRG